MKPAPTGTYTPTSVCAGDKVFCDIIDLYALDRLCGGGGQFESAVMHQLVSDPSSPAQQTRISRAEKYTPYYLWGRGRVVPGCGSSAAKPARTGA